ncbi:hypothetical protein PSACC_01826, partial [Paramicrosporidium saccamoebae]
PTVETTTLPAPPGAPSEVPTAPPVATASPGRTDTVVEITTLDMPTVGAAATPVTTAPPEAAASPVRADTTVETTTLTMPPEAPPGGAADPTGETTTL